MIPTSVLLPVCIVLAVFSGYTFAAYASDCTTDATCVAADFTTCVLTSGCAQATCTGCMTGYTSDGSACTANFGTACTGAGDCTHLGAASTTACTSSVCACAASHTWSMTYTACVPDGLEFGSACTTLADDCHVDVGDNGACTSSLCDCVAGYIKGAGHVCRLPYYGEACTAEGCQVSATSQPDEQAPTCQSSVCACAAADEITTYNGETFCNTIVASANKIATSLTCTAHNECSSGKCVTCPDTTGLICIDDTDSSSSKVTIQPVLVLVFTFITGMLQL